ncbi:helix-turn-helix transcriptional regulator [Naasia lichenicola]|uniref:Helix-turn-helix domain-containing protein n=1 Tax=Naasia lichenicola TaxID=2565933 RepID=A0A4S4FQI6_9MICO|nr:helix-turn-helix transcriptional regulator [Naasia lichenicola]THG32830.1 helix-turn-helix domain-containing protein [Naasia lichenicola]
MEKRDEVREFLATRRARLTPEQAGIVSYGTRRVAGLRREEVAQLAGVSADYYTRLERGRTTGVTESVLDAIARALQLDDTERAHLFDIAKPSPTRIGTRPATPTQRVRPGLLRLLDAMSDVPAMIQGRRMDILATNPLGEALYLGFGQEPGRPRNMARFVFLDPQAPELFQNWERSGRDCVGMLRYSAGRHPDDRQLNELIGELSVRSPHFRAWWADHNVRRHTTGTKHFNHPIVGEITVGFESLYVGDDLEQNLVTYTAEPHSTSAQALKLLASWTITPVTASNTDTTSARMAQDS